MLDPTKISWDRIKRNYRKSILDVRDEMEDHEPVTPYMFAGVRPNVETDYTYMERRMLDALGIPEDFRPDPDNPCRVLVPEFAPETAYEAEQARYRMRWWRAHRHPPQTGRLYDG